MLPVPYNRPTKEAQRIYELAKKEREEREPSEPVAKQRQKKDDKPEDTTPIKERLEKIGTHLRKNVVSANYGSDAGVKIADNIYKKFVASADRQDDLLKKASDGQKDVLESLSASMIRFRKDDKQDVKKFRQEMLAVLQQTYATDGDEDVKKYVEQSITSALKDSEKFQGVDGAIHKWFTKDKEANKNSWLFRTVAGTEGVQKEIDLAKNAGTAQNEQEKLNEKLQGGRQRGTPTDEVEGKNKMENLLRDLMKNGNLGKFPEKIDKLMVEKMIVNSMEKGEAKTRSNRSKNQGENPETEQEDVEGADTIKRRRKIGRKKLAQIGNGDMLFPKEPVPAPIRPKNSDAVDVDFKETLRKPKTKAVGYKKSPALTHDEPLLLGHEKPKRSPLEDAPVKPKYQGKLKTKEKPIVAAVRAAMNATNTSVPVKEAVAAKPVMNQFEARVDRADSIFEDSKPVPALPAPEAKEPESQSPLAAVTDMIPDIDLDRKKRKGPKAKGKPGKVGKALNVAKTAGKVAAVAGAGMAVVNGVGDLVDGKKVESLSDIVPKGGLLDKLNPAEYAMRGGMYVGDKINKGYEGVSKMFGGSGSMGSDIYDLLHSKKKETPKVEPKPAAPNMQVSQVSSQAKELTGTQAPQAGPTIINNNHAAPAAKSESPATLVTGAIRTRESYFDKHMMKTFSPL